MAGQAGWYRAPGEEGLLRYWNGNAWTDHRQPAPAAVQPPVTPEPAPDDRWDAPQASTSASVWEQPTASEPDWSMEQFEKQFRQANDSVLTFDPQFDSTQLDSTQSGSGQLEVTQSRSPQLEATQTSSNPPGSTPLESSVAPHSLVPPTRQMQSAPAALTSIQPTALALSPASFPPPASTELAVPVSPAPIELVQPPVAVPVSPIALPSAAIALPAAVSSQSIEETPTVPAPEAAGFRPSRAGVLRALKGMGVGLALVLIGLAIMFFLGQQTAGGPGEGQTVGIVTSIGQQGGGCTPIARFAGRGGSFSATTAGPVSPCSFNLGQSVTVNYQTADPKNSGMISVPNPFVQWAWVVPVLGGILFVGSVVIFIVSAGTIAGGIAIARGTDRRRRSTAVPVSEAGPGSIR